MRRLFDCEKIFSAAKCKLNFFVILCMCTSTLHRVQSTTEARYLPMYKPSIYNNTFHINDKRYIYNTMTGYCAEIDDDTKAYIKTIADNPSPEDNPRFEELLDGMIIVDASCSEYALYYFASKEMQFTPCPDKLYFSIAPTRRCNSSCLFCNERKRFEEQEDMPLDIQDKTVEYIMQQVKKSKCQTLRISWEGGEPLLNLPCMERISRKLLRFCDENHVKYYAAVRTNGILLDENTADILHRCQVRSIEVTIDGKEKGCDQYGRLRIENLVSYINKFNMHFRFNVDDKNYEDLRAMAIQMIRSMTPEQRNRCEMYLAQVDGEENYLIKSRDYNDCFHDFIALLADWGMKQSIRSNLPKPRAVYCTALLRSHYAIDVNGNLLKCERCFGNDHMACGTVTDGPFFSECEMCFIEMPYDDECKKCSLLPICGGGCTYKKVCKGIPFDCASFKERLKVVIKYLFANDHK